MMISNDFCFDEFTEEKLSIAKNAVEKYEKQIDDGVDVDATEYVGNIRIGNLCFDLVLREYGDDTLTLSYDLYVGGVDTGYGYSDRNGNKNYPYDYVDGSSFYGWMDMSYEDFKRGASMQLKLWLEEVAKSYRKADLIIEANKPLNVW